MKKLLFALALLASAAHGGTILEVTTASATVKVQAVVAPGGYPAVDISSTSVNISAGNQLVGQFVNPPGVGGQLLLKGIVVGETPNIGVLSQPLSGIAVGVSWHNFIVNRVAMWSVGRNGLGLGQWTGNAITRKDADDPRNSPSIENEGNHDGITWIDNRLPDGVLGHDPAGRALRFQIAGKNVASVSSAAFTVQGVVESTAGFKFPDGTVQTTAAGAGSNVFDSIVLTPRASPPASPAVGTIYMDSTTNQARWWNGSAWIVAW